MSFEKWRPFRIGLDVLNELSWSYKYNQSRGGFTKILFVNFLVRENVRH